MDWLENIGTHFSIVQIWDTTHQKERQCIYNSCKGTRTRTHAWDILLHWPLWKLLFISIFFHSFELAWFSQKWADRISTSAAYFHSLAHMWQQPPHARTCTEARAHTIHVSTAALMSSPWSSNSSVRTERTHPGLNHGESRSPNSIHGEVLHLTRTRTIYNGRGVHVLVIDRAENGLSDEV